VAPGILKKGGIDGRPRSTKHRKCPASTRCSGFRRNSSPFEPSLWRVRSPLPGNGISRPEKKAPIRRPSHGSAVSETKRSHKKPANAGPFSTTTGNLRNRRNAWWAWEDSKLQPDHYEWSARPLAACFSILMDEPECGALVGPGERNALEQDPDVRGRGWRPSTLASTMSGAR